MCLQPRPGVVVGMYRPSRSDMLTPPVFWMWMKMRTSALRGRLAFEALLYPASCQSIQACNELHTPSPEAQGVVVPVPHLLHHRAPRTSENSPSTHWCENSLCGSSFSSLRGGPARAMGHLGE